MWESELLRQCCAALGLFPLSVYRFSLLKLSLTYFYVKIKLPSLHLFSNLVATALSNLPFSSIPFRVLLCFSFFLCLSLKISPSLVLCRLLFFYFLYFLILVFSLILPETIKAPSGEKATLITAKECPDKVY